MAHKPRTRNALAAVWVVVAVSATGCGHGGGGGDGGGVPAVGAPGYYRVLASERDVGPPPSRETLDEAEKRIAAVVATGDCDRMKQLFTILTVDVQTQETCDNLELIERAKLVGAASYGDEAAVLDFAGHGPPASILLLRDADGLYRITFFATHRSPSTVDTDVAGSADGTALAVVDAVGANDCNAFLGRANPWGGVGTLTDAQACQLMQIDLIRKEVFYEPDAEPTRIGGNSHYAFYALDTPEAYVVFVLAKFDPGPGAPPPHRAPTDAYGYVASYQVNAPAGLEPD